MKKLKQTTKKTKIIGKETYINQATGEIQEMNVIDITENTDANFHKIWLGHILSALDIIGSQKIKVLNYFLENMNKENLVIGTYDVIINKTGVSRQTVQLTIKALKESNIITTVQRGVYRINPNVIFKGYNSTRMDILYRYHCESSSQKSDKNDK